jgi:hypothetical protein
MFTTTRRQWHIISRLAFSTPLPVPQVVYAVKMSTKSRE